MKYPKDKLFEKLADIEHERWADWQSWCHKILRENCPSPELEKVLERWDMQIATNYEFLSEEEKDSDRDEADKIQETLIKSYGSSPKDMYENMYWVPEVKDDKIIRQIWKEYCLDKILHEDDPCDYVIEDD